MSTLTRGMCTLGDTCGVLAQRMAQPLRPADRRKQGACQDVEIAGVYNRSLCQTAPHDKCLGGRGNLHQDLLFGLGADELCCECGGGEAPSHAYDWLRVYYREGAYQRKYPRINITDRGRTGLLPGDASSEAEWAGWLRGAGGAGAGAVPGVNGSSRVTPVWLFNLLENALADQQLGCCPRPRLAQSALHTTSLVGCRCVYVFVCMCARACVVWYCAC